MMHISEMFKRDINRDINGVVKVDQNDDNSIRQELEEYVVTRDHVEHIRNFVDAYSKSIGGETDKMGVWISGFFGSGKSHFLKMLSYLLANKEVAGKRAVEYFDEDKISDPLLRADIDRCVSVPTETILFNVDLVGPHSKGPTAILDIFARMFYRCCGYYDKDIRIAKLEQLVDAKGKTEEFRSEYKRQNGASWEDDRPNASFNEDEIAAVMQSVLGMTEEAAHNWFSHDHAAEMTIEKLADEIKRYVDGKGGDYHLLFMADEVGQYIGSDVNLMLNLQTITEALGTACKGKVWVMVTSQEAIDEVTQLASNDFSKIQGRFNTRISLSSKTVDDIIKQRILDKTDEARDYLMASYAPERVKLANLFSFTGALADIKGYSGEEDFASSFPFVPYQFLILQKVFVEIRKHGNAGKHLAGGERSMLSAFQDAAKSIQHGGERTFAPFSLFYDTIKGVLDSPIRQVIGRAQRAADDGHVIEHQDVDVLKTLYLIKYIDDIPATVENICVLSIRSLDADKIAMKEAISASLDRLMSQNYITRSSDQWSFLTDEEQEVTQEIKNTNVDSGEISKKISEIIFEDIFKDKKLQRGKQAFSFEKRVDDDSFTSGQADLRIRIITDAKPFAGAARHTIIAESTENRDATLILLQDAQYPYYRLVEDALKVQTYVKRNSTQRFSEVKQQIVRVHNARANDLIDEAREAISRCIVGGTVYILGELSDQRAASAGDMIREALLTLANNVFSKFDLVANTAETDTDIHAILGGGADGTVLDNDAAMGEIEEWLGIQHMTKATVTMEMIQSRYAKAPYGWRDIDIAALVAHLLVAQKIEIRYGGDVVDKDDGRLVSLLRKKSETARVIVSKRVSAPDEVINKVRNFMKDYLSVANVPQDEDGLVAFVVDELEKKKESWRALLQNYSKLKYPKREDIDAAISQLSSILSKKTDRVLLLRTITEKTTELFDSCDAAKRIEEFFSGSQKRIYDEAYETYDAMMAERTYYEGSDEAKYALEGFESVFNAESPFGMINKLPGFKNSAKKVMQAALDKKRSDVAAYIEARKQEIDDITSGVQNIDEIKSKAQRYIASRHTDAETADTLTKLDALTTQVHNYVDSIRAQVEAMLAAPPKPEPVPNAPAPAPQMKIATVRRTELCPSRMLANSAEVDAYVERIRARLTSELDGRDFVKVM